MRTLYLLRHAKSSWSDPALPDHERPLEPRGVRDAKRIAEHLGRLQVAPALVLCSSATRTRETLALVRPRLGGAPVQVEDELYAASSDALLERLRRLPDDVGSALLIGHNPGLHDLALLLVPAGARRRRLEAKFRTSALATLAIRQPPWRGLGRGDAELVAYVVPKQLR